MFLRLTFAALATLALLALAPPSARACDGKEECRPLPIDQLRGSGVALAADESEVRAKDEAKDELKVPPLWAQFKSYAYAQLPQHREKNFEATWVAMPVYTSDETVAGLGLEGTWW